MPYLDEFISFKGPVTMVIDENQMLEIVSYWVKSRMLINDKVLSVKFGRESKKYTIEFEPKGNHP